MNWAEDFREGLEEAVQLAELIRERREDLAEAAALDAGFPIKVTRNEISMAVHHLETMEEEIASVAGGHPYGTIAGIFPYDAPAVFTARLGGAALLTGNQLRFTFSSLTPRTGKILSQIAMRFDRFEPVNGVDNREFGKRCIEDDSVRVLFISGSSSVGQVYRRHLQSFDKIFFAGPGGMPAAIIFADADPEAASQFITKRAFINGGQYCTTLKKVLIHESLYEAVRERILALTQAIKVGDPLDPQTDIGPIKAQRTIQILRNGIEKCNGAKLLTGGVDGEWVHPMVLEMEKIPDLELFGPFLAMKPFQSPLEACKELTKSRYGFLVVWFGTPPDEGRRLLEDNFGMVHANPSFTSTNLRLPFGGKKDSGWILERTPSGWKERDGGFLYSKELVHKEWQP